MMSPQKPVAGAGSRNLLTERQTVGRCGQFLFAPVDNAFLVYFRVVFGAVMLWNVWSHFHSGFIENILIAPRFHFTYFGFAWVRPWSGNGMYLHYVVLAISATCLMLGLVYRLSAIVFCLGFTYVFLLEKAVYLNHYYLVCLISLILVFVPAHRTFSLDVLFRPGLRSATTPAWTLWLLRAQIGIPYFYGGLAKLNSDWLSGQPMGMMLAQRGHFPFLGQYFTQEWMAQFFSYGGLLFDLLVVPLLLWRRTRLAAFALAIVFHVLNAELFHIGIFPWLMILATPVFFAPDWPRMLLGIRKLIASRPSPQVVKLSWGQKITSALLLTYLAMQLLIPLRHFLYAGNVSWTEEGHRFAWHMMLRGKSVAIRFRFVDSKTGRGVLVPIQPGSYLNQRQTDKMGKDPDMILEFSQFLARQLQASGYDDIEIRAVVWASLNGRKPQLLIDPDVNLSAQKRTLRPKPWIVPLMEPLPDKPYFIPPKFWKISSETKPQSAHSD